MSDFDRLKDVVKTWRNIQKENEHDRKFVSEKDWNNWVEYDVRISEGLLKIIDNFHDHFTDTQAGFVNGLTNSIANVRHVSSVDLEKEYEKNMSIEKQRDELKKLLIE